MTDTDGLLSEWIADLERQLAKAQENGEQLLLMCSQKTNQIDKLTHSNPSWEMLIATQESLREHREMVKKKDKSYEVLKAHLETCQDRYDHDMAEAEAEIANLKKGFIDVDEAFKVEMLRQAIRNTLDTGMDRYISEALEKTKPVTEEQ